jgi:hypothetical protein
VADAARQLGITRAERVPAKEKKNSAAAVEKGP